MMNGNILFSSVHQRVVWTAKLVFMLGWMILPSSLNAQFASTNKNGTLTITGYSGTATELVIPDTIDGIRVVAIGAKAFKGASFSRVTIPDSVESIEASAFAECRGLTALDIPDKVKTIGEAAFSFCDSLTVVALGENLASIGPRAFLECLSLSTINIPTNVQAIGDGAFDSCGNLKTLVLPEGVRTLGSRVFAGTGLESVHLPSGITSISDGMYENCAALRSVSIPESVTAIGAFAFCDCRNLNRVTIPSSVLFLGYGAFQACGALTDLSMAEGLTTIDGSAFFSCGSLTSVFIPKSVRSIGMQAFQYCATLERAYFHGTPPTSGMSVFEGTMTSIYHLPGSTGWGPLFADRPTFLWNPEISTTEKSFGLKYGRFGFVITGTSGIPVAVEASEDLAQSAWMRIMTGTLTGGATYFSDADFESHPKRVYRIAGY